MMVSGNISHTSGKPTNSDLNSDSDGSAEKRTKKENAATGVSAAGVRAISAQLIAFYFRVPVKAFFRTRVEYVAPSSGLAVLGLTCMPSYMVYWHLIRTLEKKKENDTNCFFTRSTSRHLREPLTHT